jgi:hypothetical protein
MAQPITCDGPDADLAVFLITNVPEAETSGMCLPCALDFAQGLLAALAPERLAQAPAKPKRAPRAKPAAAAAAAGQADQPATAAASGA